MTSPICTVNGGSTLNGVNLAAATGYTIALADVAGVTSWSLTCIGTDDTLDKTAITSGLSINQVAKNATATSPAAGTALIFQSVVNNGKDVNGIVVPAYTTTFAVYVLTTGGLRVAAVNETTEGDAAFGYTSKFNALVRGAIALAVLAVAPTPNTVPLRDGTGGIKASYLDSGAAADLPLKRNAVTIASVSATGLLFDIGVTGLSLTQTARASDVACSDMTVTPQAPWANATTTKRNPGNFIIALSDPTNGQTAAGGAPLVKVTQGANTYCQFGRRKNNSVSNYGIYWAGNVVADDTNYAFGSDGSTSSVFNTPTGGTAFHTFGGVPWLTGTAASILVVPAAYQWSLGVAAPSVSQQDQTAGSTNGQAMKVAAQNATGTTSTGGQLTLTSGTGTTAAGNVVLQTGGTDRVTVAPTTITLTPPTLQWAASVNVSLGITQADQTAGSTNGQKIVIQAQNATGATSVGGVAQLQGGTGTTAGGQAQVNGGAGSGNGNGGNVTISAGLHAGSGTDGAIQLKSGAGTVRLTVDANGIGFYTTAGVAQQTRAGQITDNTGGAASTTLAAITAGASYAQADMTAVKNALASIAAQYNKIDTIIHNLGLST